MLQFRTFLGTYLPPCCVTEMVSINCVGSATSHQLHLKETKVTDVETSGGDLKRMIQLIVTGHLNMIKRPVVR